MRENVMTIVTIRQLKGTNIISIPKAIVKTLGLQTGSKFAISIEEQNIVLTPFAEDLSLVELLANSPKGSFALLEEDKEWIGGH
jgi:antitoxin ChpS